MHRGETHDAVHRLWEDLAHPGDAQAAEGVAHKAGVGMAVAQEGLVGGRRQAVDRLGTVEGPEGNVRDVHEDHRVPKVGLAQLP